jgi:(p)ppGpp synthase/HD superfamily hydrolase
MDIFPFRNSDVTVFQEIQTEIDSLRLQQRACTYASGKHAGKFYPDSGLPYSNHIEQVVLTVFKALRADNSLDVDLAICCAYLHDVVEDSDATIEDIREKFGRAIADGVAALTRDKTLERRASMEDSLRRIREQPKEIWIVKIADRIANLRLDRPLPDAWSAEKCLNYAEEGELILRYLSEASEILSWMLFDRIRNWIEAAEKKK